MADHDNSYKLLFSHPEMVADLLRGFVPESWVAQLDFGTLEKMSGQYVAEELRDREDDLIWRVRWGADDWLYVYLLLEFQSDVDPYMAVRILAYVALLYQDLIRQKQVTAAGQLPPVLPLVLYNGERRWTAAPEVAELIAPVPAELRPYHPRLRYRLVDELRLALPVGDDPPNLAGALFRLEQSRRLEEIEAVVDALLRRLPAPEQRSLRRAFVEWFKRVFRPTRLPGVELQVMALQDLPEVRAMLADRLRESWEQDRQAAREQGRAEGRVEGRMEALRTLLEYRFGALPPWVDGRLQGANLEQLEKWTRQVLQAPNLEALFQAH